MFQFLLLVWLALIRLQAGPVLGSDPAIPPGIQVTTFASGLNYPYGMYSMPDGSLMVATSNSSGSLFSSNLQLMRFQDADHNGVADGPGAVVFNGPAGPATSLAGANDILVVSTGANTGSSILILQASGSSVTQIGSLQFTYGSSDWWHETRSVAIREVGGSPGTYEVLFNIGSQANNAATVATVGVSGLVNSTLSADSVYRLTFTVNGSSAGAASLTQVASGLRNAFGLGVDAAGNTYIIDNGIDGAGNTPLSADELNRIDAGTSGVVNFGFPNTYVDYFSGSAVGSSGVLPQVSFLPWNGRHSQGPAGMSFAPSGFPAGLNNGIFIGFHGVGSAGGTANDENPVVYVDLATNTYFHFLLGGQPGQGHLNSLAASGTTLYVADLSSTGSLNQAGTGVIYAISAADTDVPEPAAAMLALAGLIAVLRRRS